MLFDFIFSSFCTISDQDQNHELSLLIAFAQTFAAIMNSVDGIIKSEAALVPAVSSSSWSDLIDQQFDAKDDGLGLPPTPSALSAGAFN